MKARKYALCIAVASVTFAIGVAVSVSPTERLSHDTHSMIVRPAKCTLTAPQHRPANAVEEQVHGLILQLYPFCDGDALREQIGGPVSERVKEELIAISSRSEENKQLVTRCLGRFLDGLEVIGYHSVFEVAAEVLGTIRSEESIDILFRHLGYSETITNLSLRHEPMSRALADIGTPVVPRLGEVLLSKEKDLSNGELAKENAAKTLWAIYTRKAHELLRRAVEVEENQDVQGTIEFYLDVWSPRKQRLLFSQRTHP